MRDAVFVALAACNHAQSVSVSASASVPDPGPDNTIEAAAARPDLGLAVDKSGRLVDLQTMRFAPRLEAA